MPNVYLRYNVVRVADVTDDQKSGAAIAAALSTSVSQEDLQQYVLSQIKRIIWGTKPGHWYTDFLADGLLSLSDFALPVTNASLLGLLDGSNRTFTTASKFVHEGLGVGPSIEVFHNGRRLIQSATADPRIGDYWVSESGGTGAGYDTVNFVTFAPGPRSSVIANYFRAP